jgi:Major Facilitator Superfamily
MIGRLTISRGPLVERDYRLLFTATTVSTLGDALAGIALAFAVLEVGSAAGLGIVFATRQGVEVIVLVFGAVLSDRLPRNLVLVGASLVQSSAQAATGALVLSGHASIASIAALQALYGVGQGFVWPAEVGLVPQTVSASRLQQANALQGLSRNMTEMIGPAVGGALVVAGSPGLALVVDAASFVVAAALLSRIRVGRSPDPAADSGYLTSLREGWHEFVSHAWLWPSVICFGVTTFAYAGWLVLGPVVAKHELGGAGAWAAILTAAGAGAVIGGVVTLRFRPERPLVASVVAVLFATPEIVALALGLPVWVIASVSFVGGIGLAVHIALWFTVFQQEVPEHARSRVSSYDALGSLVMMPVGYAVAGPLAATIGASATLFGIFALELGSLLAVLAIPAVWMIHRAQPRSPTTA